MEDISYRLIMHLKGRGYVVVADIDVKSILKRALNFDFKDYHIYEICRPEAAKEIIGNDDLNGLFVPCKLIIFEDGNMTKVRLLKSSEVANHFFRKGKDIIKKYEDELIEVIDSFSP